MREFTSALQSIVSVVSGQLDVLPASQGAIQEMAYVGEEERDDAKLSGEDLGIGELIEVPKPIWRYRPIKPIPRKDDHVFRYFIDGSYRCFYLATGLEHDRATPIFLSQIAIAIVQRTDDGKIHMLRDYSKREWILLVAKSKISDIAWNAIQDASRRAGQQISLADLAEEDPLSGKATDSVDLRQKGQSKTRYLMGVREIDIASDFRAAIPDGWLIKDGVISIGAGRRGITTRKMIGVAKQSTSLQQFSVGDGKAIRRENASALLGRIPANHRTPVFSGLGGKTGFWYLRLRESRDLQFPLYGVIKIEIPNLEEQPLTAEFIDWLSGALLAEKNVTPYGSDDRWHSHLYPVYQAEHACKQLFYSDEVIQGCINNALRSLRQ
jgi:hypothetical protein